jgi:NitT/TauT family transport system substrate-binding protein
MCLAILRKGIPEMTTKVVSEVSGIVFSIPWLVARDEGLFAEEELEVELVRAAGIRNGTPEENPITSKQPITDHSQVDSILGHTLFEEQKVQLYRA